MAKFWILFLIGFVLFSGSSGAQSLKDDPSLIDLERKRQNEIASLPRGYVGVTSSTIEAHFEVMNEEVLRRLEADVPVSSSNRVSGLSFEQAQLLFDSIDKHPVAGKQNAEAYTREGTDIGYCFGRAAYYHLLMLRMGVSRNSLRKIWVLASIQQGGSDWGHHVALTVKGTQPGQWWVLDPFLPKVMEARSWFRQMNRYTRDPQMRLYTTEASKFSLNLGTYDPVQLGLQLDRQSDWYKGYFQDLLKWFRTTSPRALGLPERFERPRVVCHKVHS